MTSAAAATADTNARRLVAAATGMGVLIAAFYATTTPAAAAIRCDRGFQITKSGEISTPYCQDNYLAQVAREYGMQASAARVRNNPNYKREVCRFVGRDIRVQQNCLDEFNSRGGRF